MNRSECVIEREKPLPPWVQITVIATDIAGIKHVLFRAKARQTKKGTYRVHSFQFVERPPIYDDDQKRKRAEADLRKTLGRWVRSPDFIRHAKTDFRHLDSTIKLRP